VSFLRGLIAGRSHVAVLLGLVTAALTVGAVHRLSTDGESWTTFAEIAPPASEVPIRPSGALDDGEKALAIAAWSYFERNTDSRTGLAGSVKGQPTTTLWDIGSQLLAVLAAEDLELVPRGCGEALLGSALRSLAAMPLCPDGLPNKAYDVRSLEMVSSAGRPAPDCVGWSALDVARALLPLSLVVWRHPELTPLVRTAVARWRLEALSDGSGLHGASRGSRGRLEIAQEGRLGYEQHAAKALLRWGLPAEGLLDYGAHARFAHVLGQPVPLDSRRARDHDAAPAALVPEPWLLDALENGLDAVTLPVTRALLRAQERRYATTGRLTAVSEDALDRAPWFAYSAVLNGDERWTALAPGGTRAEGALTFSAKAAVAWGVLFSGDYPERLLAAARELVVPGEGIWAGRYDATWEPNRVLSLNTNAVVLEALAYRVRGPAVRASAADPTEETR